MLFCLSCFQVLPVIVPAGGEECLIKLRNQNLRHITVLKTKLNSPENMIRYIMAMFVSACHAMSCNGYVSRRPWPQCFLTAMGHEIWDAPQCGSRWICQGGANGDEKWSQNPSGKLWLTSKNALTMAVFCSISIQTSTSRKKRNPFTAEVVSDSLNFSIWGGPLAASSPPMEYCGLVRPQWGLTAIQAESQKALKRSLCIFWLAFNSKTWKFVECNLLANRSLTTVSLQLATVGVSGNELWSFWRNWILAIILCISSRCVSCTSSSFWIFDFLYPLGILHVVSGLDIPGHSNGIDDSTDRFNFSLRNRNCKQRCGPQSNMFKTQILIEHRMYQEVRSQKSF